MNDRVGRRTMLGLVATVPLLVPRSLRAAGGFTVVGAGETIITGGTGAPALSELKPVKSIFAIRATRKGEGTATGRFECLALAPGGPSGAGSGEFTENVMYVTGVVTELTRLNTNTALLKGQGRCSGLGAGESVLFEAVVKRGGPGATIRLVVNTLPGVEFFEIVTRGSIEFIED